MFAAKLTPQDHENLRQWFLEGTGYTECAKRLQNKVTKQRLKQIAQKMGIDATSIRIETNWQSHQEKMVAKFGDKWQDAKWRRSAIYQAMREKFRAKKANANRTGVEFTIPFGELTFPTHCPVLGIEIDYFSEGRQENSPSFDRFDPSKGYVSGNVAVVSWRANRIKNDGTAEELRKIADWMAKHQ
jgi:hypothetical protein